MTMTATSSRRRYLRLKVEGVAIWRPAGESEESAREGKVRDLSLNGFCFVPDGDLEVETPLCFELRLRGEERPRLRGEAVVAWSTRDEASAGDFLVGAQFAEVDSTEVLALLLEAYPDKSDLRACLCGEVQFCSDAEKGRCPAYQQRKNCWEFQELECCRISRSECCNCPYAALAFLM